jgi:hypothetical protein
MADTCSSCTTPQHKGGWPAREHGSAHTPRVAYTLEAAEDTLAQQGSREGSQLLITPPSSGHRARQPHFSELPAVRADGARGDGSGTPGLAPAHIFGEAAVELQSCGGFKSWGFRCPGSKNSQSGAIRHVWGGRPTQKYCFVYFSAEVIIEVQPLITRTVTRRARCKGTFTGKSSETNSSSNFVSLHRGGVAAGVPKLVGVKFSSHSNLEENVTLIYISC